MAKKKLSTQQLWSINMFMLFLLLIELCSHVVESGSVVKFLPGFEGPLPFELETGYIGVGKSEDVQLFYYFTKSESNPESDPLVLWLTGGPGCSALSGLLYEIGPITFEKEKYNGSLPRMVLNPYSWTKVASVIFLDSPVGTGFSYARTASAFRTSDTKTSGDTYEFIQKWLIEHPEFISNPFYVAGDSYSGIPVPIISILISDGNEKGIEPRINLKGYILGNPVTFPEENNYKIAFAHGMALISDELYQSLQENCKGNYQNVDPSNVGCLQNMDTFNELLDGLDTAHTLDWTCGFAAPKPDDFRSDRRYLHEGFLHLNRHPLAALRCHIDWYRLSYYWADDESVREALHIEKGSIGNWVRCNYGGLQYEYTAGNTIPYHANLSAKGYRSLIYSGDHDTIVTFLSTQAWIRSLNYSIVDEWRKWIVRDQIVGYTRTYSNKMTFATVKGGGHTAPEYKPCECQAMIERWLSHEPL